MISQCFEIQSQLVWRLQEAAFVHMYSGVPLILPLEELVPGQVGMICDLSGDETTIHRLAEMGLQLGSEVQLKQAGVSPLQIRIEGRDLMLRCHETVQILVQT